MTRLKALSHPSVPITYRVAQKVSYVFGWIFQRIRNIFKNSFTVTLIRKFAIKRSLQIPSHLNGIATLPCEILVSENIAYPIRCGTVF